MRKFQGKELVVATHNEGKLDEVRALFANKSVEILSSKSLDLPEPIETEDNFIRENQNPVFFLNRKNWI